MKPLNKKTNLTRWNRSGLNRFRYVDGNAITHLESLRLAMSEAFINDDGDNQWLALETAIPVPLGERSSERQARWLKQYRDERRDYAWEILRTYARATHVLTEHLDAYANEGYIGTATQWDNVRKLVEMLDYHPAPPASAETMVALLVKEDERGDVATGLSFKNKPTDGSPAAVFETLADLEVDAALNELRAAEWDKSQLEFDYVADGDRYRATFPLSQPLADVSVGTPGVLLVELADRSVGIYIKVAAVSDQALTLVGNDRPGLLPSSILRHQVKLLLKPGYIQAPQLRGGHVVTLSAGHGLGVTSIVAWEAGTTWQAARVEAVDGNTVKLSAAIPAAGTSLYLASGAHARQVITAGCADTRVILPRGVRETGALWNSELASISVAAGSPQKDSTDAVPLYDFVSDSRYPTVYYVLTAPSIATVEVSDPVALVLDGDAGDLSDGDWLIMQNSSGEKAGQLISLDEGEKSFSLVLSPMLDEIETLYGAFELTVYPDLYHVNGTPIFDVDITRRSDSFSWISLETIPESLVIGRVLVIAGKDGAMEVTIKAVDNAAGSIKVSPAIPGSELSESGTTTVYTRHDAVIYGNVVQSGHGETQNKKIIGSGDASLSGQSFDFEVEAVSFVSDSLFSAGVRAAVVVSVDQRRWMQVETLNDSEPEDPHYVVRMNEDGTLRIIFGDGRRGRRLSSGNNNVQIQYRTGVGVNANLTPYQLKKMVKPHALIEGIKQPLSCRGGNEMEAVSSLRENAPSSLLTLSRAVSLSDFTHLAAASSSVWQARAIRLMPSGLGRSDNIEVVVVPAGGGELASLKESLAESLQQHALPGVSVSVSAYQPVIFDLKVTIRVNTDEYDAAFVAEDVRLALLSGFSLAQVKLGASLYYSQLIDVVEGVEGVENCECLINADGFRDADGVAVIPRRVVSGSGGVIKRVSLDERQIIYLDEDASVVEIIDQRYSL
ncbi:MAG: hypothetical protein L3J89_11280 [Gammaproteobacteria bacterium]|nr:hypothetical protein [Gammaproteobacteria bacterium]